MGLHLSDSSSSTCDTMHSYYFITPYVTQRAQSLATQHPLDRAGKIKDFKFVSLIFVTLVGLKYPY